MSWANPCKVRWKRNTHTFTHLEDAIQWASSRPGATVNQLIGHKWVQKYPELPHVPTLHDRVFEHIRDTEDATANTVSELLNMKLSRVRYLLIDLVNQGRVTREKVTFLHDFGGKWSYVYRVK